MSRGDVESVFQSLLYKQVIEVQCRNQLANELMTYHMKVRQAFLLVRQPGLIAVSVQR